MRSFSRRRAPSVPPLSFGLRGTNGGFGSRDARGFRAAVAFRFRYRMLEKIDHHIVEARLQKRIALSTKSL